VLAMTTHASSGIQRPRPPAGHVAVNRSLPRTGSLLNQSPIGAPSKQVVIDLTETDQGERGQDHLAKRLKLDPTSVANSLGNRIGRGDGSKGAEVARHFNPRARPAWTFRGHPPQSSHSDHTTAATTGKTNDLTQSRPRSPPPLPIRPWKYGPRSSKQDEISKSREILRAGDVQTAPYSLEAQSSTPRYLQDSKSSHICPLPKVLEVTDVTLEPADFFPWVGNHPEDVLNEHTTKQGHYDRVQLSQSENNSARTSLYSTFKNRPNLDLLSSLFVSALEQRQAHGKIGSASTFKPPPRVTLTDTKRETWLRDLANSSVPLRKLSRTIPHGIRGKSLLEQCLGKGIPIGRALWLSKCVGANEIRAFKRKGTNSTFAIGGETKWVREWTVCVEQFVEGVISLCGELSWKDKLTYV
jgi:mediator of RNA polymerase II transcription subunit 12, fungi type